MEEYKEVMGGSLAERDEDNFNVLSPMESMDMVDELLKKGGNAAVDDSPKNRSLILAMVNVTDADIIDWANKSANGNSEYFSFYYQRMHSFRDQYRKQRGLPPAKSRVN